MWEFSFIDRENSGVREITPKTKNHPPDGQTQHAQSQEVRGRPGPTWWKMRINREGNEGNSQKGYKKKRASGKRKKKTMRTRGVHKKSGAWYNVLLFEGWGKKLKRRRKKKKKGGERERSLSSRGGRREERKKFRRKQCDRGVPEGCRSWPLGEDPARLGAGD